MASVRHLTQRTTKSRPDRPRCVTLGQIFSTSSRAPAVPAPAVSASCLRPGRTAAEQLLCEGVSELDETAHCRSAGQGDFAAEGDLAVQHFLRCRDILT